MPFATASSGERSRTPPASDLDGAALRARRPEDRPGRLGPAGSHESGHAEDLSLAQIELTSRTSLPAFSRLYPEHDRRVGGDVAPRLGLL